MNDTLNDPTRSGPPLSVAPGKTLRLSRNEVESVCAKAARGAGMSWGLAEEAGYAAGWLVAHGFDGAGALARHLRHAQGKSWQDICPVVEPGEWLTKTAGQPLCPIALGATLSDHLGADSELLSGSGLRVGEVSSPGLLLPFVAMAVEACSNSICVRLEHDVVCIEASGTISGNVMSLLAAECTALIIFVDEQTARDDLPLHVNRSTSPTSELIASVDSNALNFLHELSMRTTVPSSAASRARAGAVGSDND